MKKICKKCGEEKNVNDFRKQRKICRKCECEMSKEYRKNNLEKVKQKQMEFYYNNKEICNERRNNWRLNNKEYIKEYDKERYIINYTNNKTEICEKVRTYRKNNIEKVRERERKNRNNDSFREYRREYIKKHKEKNPHVYAWRTLLRNTIKRLGMKKEGKTIDMLGYSALELKENIEKKWSSGMTWENYGEWHIDHIKCVSSFTSNETAKVVNNLSNLQPMWATTRNINGIIYEGNLNKGKK
jgi:hypothetical protein